MKTTITAITASSTNLEITGGVREVIRAQGFNFVRVYREKRSLSTPSSVEGRTLKFYCIYVPNIPKLPKAVTKKSLSIMLDAVNDCLKHTEYSAHVVESYSTTDIVVCQNTYIPTNSLKLPKVSVAEKRKLKQAQEAAAKQKSLTIAETMRIEMGTWILIKKNPSDKNLTAVLAVSKPDKNNNYAVIHCFDPATGVEAIFHDAIYGVHHKMVMPHCSLPQ